MTENIHAVSDELNIINMDDVQTEQVNFLWRPYIAYGKITIVQGDGGEGKTTMMLAIAAAITTGASLPGQNISASSDGASVSLSVPADVIYQTAEDGLGDTIKPRLLQLGADCSRVHVIDEDKRELCLSDERIEQAIIRTGARLCIIDPLQAYLGGSDMHSANGIRPLMKQLAAVADRTGCALVIIGHLNKNRGKSQYRGLGSIDIHAAARSVLTVGRCPVDDSMRVVVHGKSNLALPGASMAFGFDEKSGFTWLGEFDITLDELLKGGPPKQKGSQFGQARALIESALADSGCVASVDIMQSADKQGISLKTLKRAKAALNVKSVKQDNVWYWVLAGGGSGDKLNDSSDEGGQEGHVLPVTPLTPLSKTRTQNKLVLPNQPHDNEAC